MSSTQTSRSSAASAARRSRPSVRSRIPSSSGGGFAVPGDWTDAEWKLDFRVGGGEVNRGRSPGGTHNAFESRFHEIVDNERIVFTYDLAQDQRLISVSLTRIEFWPDGDGTRLLFTEQGAFFDDLDSPAEREHGTGKLLEALERLLAAEPVR